MKTNHSITIICLLLLLFSTFSGCKPSINDSNPKRRLAAVYQMTDQAALGKIAFSEYKNGDDNNDLRVAATNKITDQIILTKLAIFGGSTKYTVGCY